MGKTLEEIAQEIKPFPVSEKKILFKDKLIENYFSNKKTLFGNRYCLFNKDIRLNRKNELQAKYSLLIIDHYTPPIWNRYDWLGLVKYIEQLEKSNVEYPYIE